jgi:hypothetical protein
MVTYDVSYGAITSLYAGTAPDASSLNGKVSSTLCLDIYPLVLSGACVIFLVSHGVGTGRGSKQEGA